MAKSPSHRFGQIVGNLLEEIILPEMLGFCVERQLYLDRHGSRAAVRPSRKVSWEDRFGNSHDLDFVLEKDGSETCRGRPVAFVEAAWRRYSKHSRAKAQEIQGAILPIVEKHEREAPFLGAVLAGVFTTPSLDQLRSVGFQIVHFPYEAIVAAFATVGIDARFDESTPDETFQACVDRLEMLSADQRATVKRAILDSKRADFDMFLSKLRRKLDRIVTRVTIIPLFGAEHTFPDVSAAYSFIGSFDRHEQTGPFRKHEVSVMFSNGDEVRGLFNDEAEVAAFLNYVST